MNRGFEMGLLYIALGIVIILTKAPLWFLGMLFITLLPVPIISLFKNTKKTIDSIDNSLKKGRSSQPR